MEGNTVFQRKYVSEHSVCFPYIILYLLMMVLSMGFFLHPCLHPAGGTGTGAGAGSLRARVSGYRDAAAGRRSGEFPRRDEGRAGQRGRGGLCALRGRAICADPGLWICATSSHECHADGWYLARRCGLHHLARDPRRLVFRQKDCIFTAFKKARRFYLANPEANVQ